MPDSDRSRIQRADILRNAEDELRRLAEAGIDPAVNALLADFLAQRADRIAAGENDHSTVMFPEFD